MQDVSTVMDKTKTAQEFGSPSRYENGGVLLYDDDLRSSPAAGETRLLRVVHCNQGWTHSIGGRALCPSSRVSLIHSRISSMTDRAMPGQVDDAEYRGISHHVGKQWLARLERHFNRRVTRLFWLSIFATELTVRDTGNSGCV